MSTQLQAQAKAAQQPSSAPAQTGFLQRKCACGQHSIAGSECEECRRRAIQNLDSITSVFMREDRERDH